MANESYAQLEWEANQGSFADCVATINATQAARLHVHNMVAEGYLPLTTGPNTSKFDALDV